MDLKLAAKINDLAKRDQEMRKHAGNRLENWDNQLDKENTEVLKEIIKQHGWPSVSLVGAEASHNAWLIAQHAVHDSIFQKNVLAILESLYAQDQNLINKSEIAFLTDRILVQEGKEQKFGTQLYLNEDNKWVLRPIQDAHLVNERRAIYDLEPIEEYLKKF